MSNIKTDILVVGTGLAGALFALEMAKRRPDVKITVIYGKEVTTNSSYLAQGGIAAVLPDSDDTIEQHINDTLIAGHFTNKPDVVNYFVSKAPDAIQVLESWGVCFDVDISGRFSRALEGGHSGARVLHHKDQTGRHLMQHLLFSFKKYSNIKVIENLELFQICNKDNEGVSGVFAWDCKDKKVVSILASDVILCTGGIGGLFRYTTNHETNLGHGIALAHKAGAVIKDIINIQFHPTALYQPDKTRLSLITEALRGAGAFLRNEQGEPFMIHYHKLLDLAPRDVVSNAIIQEIGKQGIPYVFLDATQLGNAEWENHFSFVYSTCRQIGINPKKQWIPVVPAVHYSCGGVETDVKGQTNIEHLFCLGEVACTGFHGTNRLASNGLLEAAIMATSLAKNLASKDFDNQRITSELEPPVYYSSKGTERLAHTFLNQLRKIMQSYCGVSKSASSLLAGLSEFRQLEENIQTQLSALSYDSVRIDLATYTSRLILQYALKAMETTEVYK